jgi:hypothetical protein
LTNIITAIFKEVLILLGNNNDVLCFLYSGDNKFDALIINEDKEEEFLRALNVYAQHYEAAVVRDITLLHQPSDAAVEDRETYEYSCDSDFESENGTVGFANASTPCLEELENSDDEEELRLALSFGVSSSSKQDVNALPSDGHSETLLNDKSK